MDIEVDSISSLEQLKEVTRSLQDEKKRLGNKKKQLKKDMVSLDKKFDQVTKLQAKLKRAGK